MHHPYIGRSDTITERRCVKVTSSQKFTVGSIQRTCLQSVVPPSHSRDWVTSVKIKKKRRKIAVRRWGVKVTSSQKSTVHPRAPTDPSLACFSSSCPSSSPSCHSCCHCHPSVWLFADGLFPLTTMSSPRRSSPSAGPWLQEHTKSNGERRGWKGSQKRLWSTVSINKN